MREEHSRQIDEINRESEAYEEKIAAARSNTGKTVMQSKSDVSSLQKEYDDFLALAKIEHDRMQNQARRLPPAQPPPPLPPRRSPAARRSRTAGDGARGELRARVPLLAQLVSELDIVTVHKEKIEEQLRELGDYCEKKLSLVAAIELE